MQPATAPLEHTGPAEDDYDRLLRWRCGELRRAGYDLRNAILLAVKTEIDLHLAIELRTRGCPSDTALQILS